ALPDRRRDEQERHRADGQLQPPPLHPGADPARGGRRDRPGARADAARADDVGHRRLQDVRYAPAGMDQGGAEAARTRAKAGGLSGGPPAGRPARPLRAAAATAAALAVLASGCARLARDDAVLLDAPALEAAVAALELRADAALVVAAADIAHCDQLERAAATAALAAAVVAATREAAVITMGDHAYEKGTRQEFAQCYEPTWGRLNAVTYPSPGNHDFETDDGAPYYDYFAHYRRDPAARERGYYAFEIGGWQLLALNSLLPLEAGSAQLSWLEAELG